MLMTTTTTTKTFLKLIFQKSYCAFTCLKMKEIITCIIILWKQHIEYASIWTISETICFKSDIL